MRPAPNRSHAMAFMDQTSHGNPAQAGVVALDEREHLPHGFPALGVIRRARPVFFFPRAQRLRDHFFTRAEVARLHFAAHDPLCLGRQLNAHGHG